MSDPGQLPNDSYRPGESAQPQPVTHVSEKPQGISPVISVERKTSTPEVKDGTREIIETIVFVVVLVLLLKTFLAEAFVIPTGSMATTLLGYHKEVNCEKCQYRFRVNASEEVEKRPPEIVTEWVCPNCRYHNHLKNLPRQEKE